MAYNKWTHEEDARLRELYPNYTYTELGKLMNRSRDSVRCRCGILGLNTKQEKPEEVEGKRRFTNEAKLALGWPVW